ncbi:cyclic nucleotide-binding domain-containing protein [Ruegeria discodermiae]|uniref:cyclic nucleotide-binding domain-containing protein n=1 Tax=Ruegeria discodermiae TaxID=3064389 RepID=UPI0035319174
MTFHSKWRFFLRRAQQDGGRLTLNIANTGDLVAEASLFADRYHCDAVTDMSTTVFFLPRDELMRHLEDAASSNHLSIRAFERTARDLQTLRTCIEVMRLRKVTYRLDAYLELYGPPEEGEWVRVADWIGVSPPRYIVSWRSVERKMTLAVTRQNRKSGLLHILL